MKNKPLFVIVFLAVFFLSFTLVNAEDSTTATSEKVSATPTITPKPTDVETAAKETLRQRLGEEVLNDRLKKLRETAKIRFEAKRKELLTQTSELRDAKKKIILERLVNRFEALNDKWVTHGLGVINRLEAILSKMDKRAEKLKEGGADTTSYQTAASAAKEKIAKAKTSLETTAAEVYVPDEVTDRNLGGEVKGVTTNFKEKVGGVRSAITQARDAVKAAFKALSAFKEERENE